MSSAQTPTFGSTRGNSAPPNKNGKNNNNNQSHDDTKLPALRESHAYPDFSSKRLSDIGDSTSLFSFDSPAPFDFAGQADTNIKSSPVLPFAFAGGSQIVKDKHEVPKQLKLDFGGRGIFSSPFVFGIDDTLARTRNTQDKMVNERSPAKAVHRSGSSDSVDAPSFQYNFSSKLGDAPRFGETSAPQSPLHRNATKSKEDAMFIKPKSRPEHHRDVEKSSHPHLSALKDAGRKIMEPLLARSHFAENDSPVMTTSNPVKAPVPQSQSYTTTKAAQPQMFGSLGTVNGGFQTVNGSSYAPNTRNNYIDLTTNEFRAPASDPYTFVDPAKAQEDLKALLEGAMEDEDDKPRTRSRKKKQEADVDDLFDKMSKLHVIGEKLDVESEDEDDGSVEGVKVKLLPHQTEGLEWMIGREIGNGGKTKKVPKGGILADDMGLGKTLQSISLILSNPIPTNSKILDERKIPTAVGKGTLVVAPLALIRQWELEIKEKVERSHSLNVCVHHGPSRTKRFADLKKYDVVITTYQILVSEFGNSNMSSDSGVKTGCFGLHWYRVILDEAHTIKNRNAKATQACYHLRSQYRWCLTGTPMQNNLDELQSLIKFLRIGPYDDLPTWKDQIDRPMKNGRGDVAIKRLRIVLKTFMKRRTKDILKKDGALNPGGKASVAGAASTTGFKVTERKIEKVVAEFSPNEREFYDRLESRTDASIEKMMAAGDAMNYASALVMLLRLRQACNHPKLVAGKLGKDAEALSTDTANPASKAKATTGDVDDLADMFGGLGVDAKRCEICQLDLGKQATADGAIHCLDCEKDQADVLGMGDKLKEKKKGKGKHYKEIKEEQHSRRHNDTHAGDKSDDEDRKLVRKPRNRNVVNDSDDEEEDQKLAHRPRNRNIVADSSDEEDEGSWVVGENKRGPLRLGKAGGTDDENAEGGGRWLNSEDEKSDSEADETFPDVTQIKTKNSKKKVVVLESDVSDDQISSDSDSASEVEDEIQSSSDEEAHLATIVSSTKISHLLKILGKEAAEHKFIVFSQFTSMLDLIEPFLRQKGFKYTRYDGKMRNDLREASLNKLRNDMSCRVLLCSLKCGSLGLNLTAASRVVILEPFWNPVSSFPLFFLFPIEYTNIIQTVC